MSWMKAGSSLYYKWFRAGCAVGCWHIEPSVFLLPTAGFWAKPFNDMLTWGIISPRIIPHLLGDHLLHVTFRSFKSPVHASHLDHAQCGNTPSQQHQVLVLSSPGRSPSMCACAEGTVTKRQWPGCYPNVSW
uniref:Uncharacterized protein n=1 Tax=Eutreptiella gymnastica TaxID=73025 RepID=A0A7S4D0W9_9EUGL